MELLWNSTVYKDLTPIKILIPSTGKLLCAERDLFNAYLKGEIEIKDLIEATECEGIFRNHHQMKAGKTIIDSGSLWKKKGKMVELLDNDYYYVSDFDSDNWIEV